MHGGYWDLYLIWSTNPLLLFHLEDWVVWGKVRWHAIIIDVMRSYCSLANQGQNDPFMQQYGLEIMLLVVEYSFLWHLLLVMGLVEINCVVGTRIILITLPDSPRLVMCLLTILIIQIGFAII